MLSIVVAVLAGLAFSANASAVRDIKFGFVEDQFADSLLTSNRDSTRQTWWARLKASNADFIRLNMYWSQVAPGPPKKATNPGDPFYDFSLYDRAVKEAKKRGIDVVFTVFLAPRWAEGKHRKKSARIGTWKPNPKAYGKFAKAVAKRYSGKYRGLPRVKYFEAWNEPNLPQYLNPQWKGKKSFAPNHYRKMLNSFYKGIKKGQKGATVIGGGTSPRGDGPGGPRTRPYYFWRELLCLSHSKKMKKQKRCGGGKKYAHLDVYGQNPINAVKGRGPTSKALHPDEGVPSNFHDLTAIVRKAEKQKTILPRRKHSGWATETWYESNPPEKKGGVPLEVQARFMQQAMYVLWTQKVKTMFFLQLRDTPYNPNLPSLVGFQTGIYLPNNNPKPAARAVSFPFVADRKSRNKVLLWGIAPAGGTLQVTKNGRGFTAIKARRSKVFTKTVRLRGRATLQARVGGQSSLPWNLK